MGCSLVHFVMFAMYFVIQHPDVDQGDWTDYELEVRLRDKRFDISKFKLDYCEEGAETLQMQMRALFVTHILLGLLTFYREIYDSK